MEGPKKLESLIVVDICRYSANINNATVAIFCLFDNARLWLTGIRMLCEWPLSPTQKCFSKFLYILFYLYEDNEASFPGLFSYLLLIIVQITRIKDKQNVKTIYQISFFQIRRNIQRQITIFSIHSQFIHKFSLKKKHEKLPNFFWISLFLYYHIL